MYDDVTDWLAGCLIIINMLVLVYLPNYLFVSAKSRANIPYCRNGVYVSSYQCLCERAISKMNQVLFFIELLQLVIQPEHVIYISKPSFLCQLIDQCLKNLLRPSGPLFSLVTQKIYIHIVSWLYSVCLSKCGSNFISDSLPSSSSSVMSWFSSEFHWESNISFDQWAYTSDFLRE